MVCCHGLIRELKTRQDVLKALEAQVFGGARTTKNGINVPARTGQNPTQGSHLYEQSFNALAKDLEQKSKVQQQTTGEMLKAAFSEGTRSLSERN
ncbi:MbeB family mobilization protein [Pantoea stewartii]|uniref:MbeB family mobilization protein n=1 Tax=Pantoea stewartii TaxID=66269 RepID=UPI0025A0F5D8|nr:MbeB family mobilization protein [Pantoea stewartii]